MSYDLFTTVDSYYSNFTFLNLLVWLMSMSWFFLNVNLFFYSSKRLKKISSFLLNWQYLNIKSKVMSNMKGSFIFLSGAFFLMLGTNMWGLFPYMFGKTTQMVFTLVISLMLWLSMVMSSVEFNYVSFLCHLTPKGSPLYLVPMLNLMELVSNLMRPLTLALRLSINMTTGHVLMSLMSTSSVLCLFPAKIVLLPLLFLISGYLLFEMGICFMQGFVFSLLVSQYLGEHT